MSEFSITLWNTEWATPASRTGELVRSVLHEGNPDVICVTEGYAGILPQHGHTITSDEDYGYPIKQAKRKVLLWSKAPWADVDQLGSSNMPSGRFIAGTTSTALGPVRFIGVCIPWQDAHVRSGRRDRQPWEDHLAYLDGLAEMLKSEGTATSTVLLGDFNQRVPRGRQPEGVYDRLMEVLKDRFCLLTGGALPGVNEKSIDHIAVTSHLQAASLSSFSNFTADGTRLSDHFGLRTTLRSESC